MSQAGEQTSNRNATSDRVAPPAASTPSAYRFGDGAITGAALMLALLGVNYAAQSAWHIPFVPRTVGEWLFPAVPLGTGAWAMLCVVIGAGIGTVYERLRPAPPAHGIIGGLAIGVATFAVSLPSTLVTAQNAETGITVVGTIGWFLLCALWGLALDQTGRGAAAHPVNPMDTDSPAVSRRVFLLQTMAGALLIVLLSFPIARLIDGKQLLPNLPLPFSAPPTQSSPLPPGMYF